MRVVDVDPFSVADLVFDLRYADRVLRGGDRLFDDAGSLFLLWHREHVQLSLQRKAGFCAFLTNDEKIQKMAALDQLPHPLKKWGIQQKQDERQQLCQQFETRAHTVTSIGSVCAKTL